MPELITAIDEAGFRKAMSCFASGVTIVTTEDEGHWYGLTVSAFSSLSLDPPLVLVAIEKTTRAHEAIGRAERFAVNVLREEQESISNQFASRVEDRFDGIDVRSGVLKIPVLAEALAVIECRLREKLPGGDHSIFVGEVVAADIREGNPLLYFRSDYRRLR
ncbi:MAG: flavin reductase family protein [Thermoanaerobaculia bacterium]